MPHDRTDGKNLTLIYHIDSSVSSYPWVLSAAESIFYRNVRTSDVVVVMSEYWRQQFLARGCRNVAKIYVGYDVGKFDYCNRELSDFREKHGIADKPVVFIGNCQRAKGVVDAYEALKGLDVHLVTSGKRRVQLPAKNLELSHSEHNLLTAASDVVVTMSKFNEGWCMVAHEAMLSKTPVIGSGLGGMKELLEGGGQIVCPDFKNLRANVEMVLNDKSTAKRMGVAGHRFVSQFTNERFERAWVELIEGMGKIND
jgi:glycosyltransferase involved in cell wall biosynthesis